MDDDSLFLLLDAAWADAVGDMRSGKESFRRGLRTVQQRFRDHLGGPRPSGRYHVAVDGQRRSSAGLAVDQRKDLRGLDEAWNQVAADAAAGGTLTQERLEEFLALIDACLDLDRDRTAPRAVRSAAASPAPSRVERPEGAIESAPLGAGPLGEVPDAVERRRALHEAFLAEHGFALRVPRPAVSSARLEHWREMGMELFYRPAEVEVPFRALLAAVGQEDHWTIRSAEARKGIRWEPAEVAHWFLAEAREDCPRAGQDSYNGFVRSLRPGQQPLSLEEYAIVWCVSEHAIGAILDTVTQTLLRTRYLADLLHAFGSVTTTGPVQTNEFLVRQWRVLDRPLPKMGIRIREVVEQIP